MRWYAASAMRAVIGAVAILTAACVLISGLLMVYVGIAGTGGFTPDPPPSHTPWPNIAIVVLVVIALECTILWAWRALIRVIDAAEAK